MTPSSAGTATGTFERNYVRLNERPEWYTVDENTVDGLIDGQGRETLRLGSDLKEGIEIAAPARWTVENATERTASRLASGQP